MMIFRFEVGYLLTRPYYTCGVCLLLLVFAYYSWCLLTTLGVCLLLLVFAYYSWCLLTTCGVCLLLLVFAYYSWCPGPAINGSFMP
ncbi:hypothetical protein NIES4071_26630 [Calothrix sp. NIES-4071]|nr:hypothetical protein NIES4071_26630 [Calothrix sp. NIES-4071]BAZ56985.1 hypothetical protein NIES4105_26570 [Calothrix sp. NIES-4105]